MDHKKRMAQIGFWALPPAGSEARKKFEAELDLSDKDPRREAVIQNVFKDAVALISVQSENGIGFSADRQLREYNAEYNGRVLKGSLRDMPSSFNVVEAFNKFLPHSATFELRPERDHLFSFQHFIDWVTSGGAEETETPDLHHLLAQGQIYSYNSTDDPSELCFSVEGGDQFGFASMSCVRFGDEVSLLLVAGQQCDLERETIKIRETAKPELLPHKAHIQRDDSLVSRAEPLSEASNFWKTVVLMRIDIVSKTVDARYIFQDCGNSYLGHTDDLATYINEHGEFLSDGVADIYRASVTTIKKYETLFELSKTCLLLPQFLYAHDDDVVLERHPTGFKKFRTQLKNRSLIERVNARHWITHRDVYVLPRPSVRSPDRASFIAPEYKIETKGFWRQLPVTSEGSDKLGRPIHGRTWVSQTLSWVEKPSVAASVFEKPRATHAVGPTSGYIYVMRSAAHGKDIFKVGMTKHTSDERAKKLSSTTSSPDHFLVVEEWATLDCIKAERLIHDKLQKYRINPNREYFRAKYSVTFAVIDEVISSIEAAAKT